MQIIKCPLLMTAEHMTLNMNGIKEWRSFEDCKSCIHCEGFSRKGSRVICSAPLPIQVKEIQKNPVERFEANKEIQHKEESNGHIVECDEQFHNLTNHIVAESSCQACDYHKEFRTVIGGNWEHKMAICTATREWGHTKETDNNFEERKQKFVERLEKSKQEQRKNGTMNEIKVFKTLHKEGVLS